MKNFKVSGITDESNPIVYLSLVQAYKLDRSFVDRFIKSSGFYWDHTEFRKLGQPFMDYHIEHLEKSVPVELKNSHDYRKNDLEDDKVLISKGLADKLKLLIGDKIKIKSNPKKFDIGYLFLYKNSACKFINYFNKQSVKEKKKILKELFEHDFVNEEVVAWLDKHESKLIREVGLE